MLCSRDDELYAKKYIKTFVKKRNFCRENLRYMGGYFISTVTVTDCTQKNTKLFSLNGLIFAKKMSDRWRDKYDDNDANDNNALEDTQRSKQSVQKTCTIRRYRIRKVR